MRYRGVRPRRVLNRPPVAHNFLHRVSLAVRGRLTQGSAPWWELRRRLDDHVPSTGEPRQRARRSDLTDTISMVLTCLLARMDLKSLRVGHPAGKGKRHDFVGLSRQTIAGWCGSDEATVSRALTLLREAGLVAGPARDPKAPNRIAQPYDGEDDKWLPAVRRFDLLFFVGLGFGAELHRLRTAAPPKAPTAEQQQAARSARYLVERSMARLYAPDDG